MAVNTWNTVYSSGATLYEGHDCTGEDEEEIFQDAALDGAFQLWIQNEKTIFLWVEEAYGE